MRIAGDVFDHGRGRLGPAGDGPHSNVSVGDRADQPVAVGYGHEAEIAGGHHEKMDGNGYPKRLTREEMSLPARMMAIADIFEALTAVDRPYKKGKTLSEALGIMIGMCNGAHVDSQLFALFVRSGIYRDYGQRFLKPEQIDEVDEQGLLAKLNDA